LSPAWLISHSSRRRARKPRLASCTCAVPLCGSKGLRDGGSSSIRTRLYPPRRLHPRQLLRQPRPRRSNLVARWAASWLLTNLLCLLNTRADASVMFFVDDNHPDYFTPERPKFRHRVLRLDIRRRQMARIEILILSARSRHNQVSPELREADGGGVGCELRGAGCRAFPAPPVEPLRPNQGRGNFGLKPGLLE
jgi:hypothetical protein